MERIVVDTNVLLRSLAPANEAYLTAKNALVALTNNYSEICVLPQNLIEFWNVATRPIENNGLGLTVSAANREVTRSNRSSNSYLILMIYTWLGDSSSATTLSLVNRFMMLGSLRR